ncbi:MAG TPA: hypothetical protein VKV77_02750 [Methylovirgula sp.]|nr:hypothetical protein [Methylovirgula sp.]
MRHFTFRLALAIFGLAVFGSSASHSAEATPSAGADAAPASQSAQATQAPQAAQADPPIEAKQKTKVEPALARAAAARSAAARILPEIRQFCTNNAGAASAARVAWEAAKLNDLDDRLKQRIAELEAKTAEYETWLNKRNAALKYVQEDIVSIYTKMAPEAAAAELAAMDDDLAAAVLVKLNSRAASAILGEMDPTKAAHLTNTMLGTMTTADGKKS